MADRKSEQFGTYVSRKEEKAPKKAIEWVVRRWSNVDAPKVVAGPFFTFREAQEEADRRMAGRK